MKVEILITGPAGEGKSTLARKLKTLLEAELFAEDSAVCWSTNAHVVLPTKLALPTYIEQEFYIEPEA